VQSPDESSVTSVPVTEQIVGVSDMKLTGRPESDVALTVNVSPGVGAGNVIVCGARRTVKVPDTAGAAA
jgi:hypothetical protein